MHGSDDDDDENDDHHHTTTNNNNNNHWNICLRKSQSFQNQFANSFHFFFLLSAYTWNYLVKFFPSVLLQKFNFLFGNIQKLFTFILFTKSCWLQQRNFCCINHGSDRVAQHLQSFTSFNGFSMKKYTQMKRLDVLRKYRLRVRSTKHKQPHLIMTKVKVLWFNYARNISKSIESHNHTTTFAHYMTNNFSVRNVHNKFFHLIFFFFFFSITLRFLGHIFLVCLVNCLWQMTHRYDRIFGVQVKLAYI